MVEIRIDELHDYMEDYYGTATFNGFPAAIMDAADVESISPYELCEKAEEMGIDLNDFTEDK